MSMTLQQLSDRFEIQDLLVEYCHIIDQQQFDRLDEVFTEDAFIDYTAMGGAAGGRAEIKAYLKKALPAFGASQHMISNQQIKLAGDTATGRIMCFNPMQLGHAAQAASVFFVGFWYVDEYVRTPSGWRIRCRAEEKSWVFNTPPSVGL